MLPEDTAARRKAALDGKDKGLTQTTISNAFKDAPLPIRYTDDGFRDIALEWLIATDQVCVDTLAFDRHNLIPCIAALECL